MNINLETSEPHSVKAYSESAIEINGVVYENSLIVDQHEIITPCPVATISDLNAETISPFLKHKPEIILIGHSHRSQFPSSALISWLSQQRISIECMSIGAACRTYNVLLNEGRAVVLGVIF